ncbi:MAG: YjiH family protein [Gemmatimonadetes bacterium]|nr:YjiH family protein [Gemmatimonadota bacterium]
MTNTSQDGSGRASGLRFIFFSLIGIASFLIPIPTADGANIGMGILSDWMEGLLGSALPAIVTAAVVLSALLSAWVALRKPAWSRGSGTVGSIFAAGPAGVAIRILGAILAVMVLTQQGPDWVISPDTGSVILNDLMTVIFVLFLFASILLPFLTDFGLMEFIGTLARPLFRPLFTLPGRGAVDGAASWFGSSVVGIIITTRQYEEGFYSRREAAVMATTFSVVSVAFAVVVLNFVGLGEYFVPFYGAIAISGLAAAVVLPRVPPLSRKEDAFHGGTSPEPEAGEEGRGKLAQGWHLAVRRAGTAPPPKRMLTDSVRTTFDIWFGLEPLVMVVGTLSLAVATYTPVFTWLSLPLVPALELLQLPEAAAAAPAFLVGFADQFLPVILGQSIESELTRFVIACAAVTQLIYMSEVGVLLLKSKLALGMGDLLAIFALRTIVTVPICAGIGHLVF